MENQFSKATLRCWNACIKPFLTAALLGILAGACFGELAHGATSNTLKPAMERSHAPQLIASAGRIRQQAQRIGKLHQQIALKLDIEKAQRRIDQARQQMDKDISGLMRSTITAQDRHLLDRLKQSWDQMKRQSDLPSSPEIRERMFIHADDMATLSGKLAMHFELNASSPTARLFDLTLRQGMLIQRLARLYLMDYAGDNSTGLHIDIEQARREFSSALNELINADENSAANRRALELARIQWFFFEQSIIGMKTKDDRPRIPMHVVTSSERILEVLDELSVQYADAIQAENAPVEKQAGL